MAKFIILVGSIKKTEVVRRGDKDHHIGKMHSVGAVIDLDPEEAERINKKGPIVEPLEVHQAKAKAKIDAKEAVEKAEHHAKLKLDGEKKGGGK